MDGETRLREHVRRHQTRKKIMKGGRRRMTLTVRAQGTIPTVVIQRMKEIMSRSSVAVGSFQLQTSTEGARKRPLNKNFIIVKNLLSD